MSQNDNKIDVESRIEELINIIEVLDTLYDAGEKCVHPFTHKEVTDGEYDELRSKLYDLRDRLEKQDSKSNLLENPIFHEPSASQLKNNSSVVIHDPPLTSISKANGSLQEKNKILTKWMKDCVNELGVNPYSHNQNDPIFVTSFKRDGVAIALYYKKGELVQAGLRPRDGIHGEDVTKNAIMVDGIPKNLPIPITCSIRGEIECRKSVFKKIVKDIEKKGKKNKVHWSHKNPPANPRNFTAGSIRHDDPQITKLRHLSFMAYSVVGYANAPYQTEIDRAKWCQKQLGIPFIFLKAFKYENLAAMESESEDLDFEVDGVVISVNNLEDSEQLGTHGNSKTANPKGKIAWKFAEQSRVIEVKKDILYQTGRTGRITPVVEFDPVDLAGTKVTRATAHNIGIVVNDSIGVGSHLRIIKSGKIIPKIVEVIKKSDNVKIPSKCPSCGSVLIEQKSKIATDLFCHNEKCPAQNVQSLVYYLSTFGVKGVGESMVNNLVLSGLVKIPADFYSLTTQDLWGIGITQRMALLTIARIHMIKNPDKIKDNDILMKKIHRAMSQQKKITLEKFVACLGISQVSKGVASKLSEKYDGIKDIMDVSKKDLENIEDIGPIVAKSIFDFFQENRIDVETLLKYVDIEKPIVGKFTGMKFCFTGEFPNGRGYWQKLCQKEGAKVVTSMSKSVTHAVVGPNAGSKKQKAEKYKKEGLLKIIGIDTLEQMLDR